MHIYIYIYIYMLRGDRATGTNADCDCRRGQDGSTNLLKPPDLETLLSGGVS